MGTVAASPEAVWSRFPKRMLLEEKRTLLEEKA